MAKLVPLFPLPLVAFPRTQVPLHIFEERYKLMVGESIAASSEFGIVLAQGGGIVNAGCTVRVENVMARYDDGRLDIMTVGARRFDVLAINQEKAYLQGEVEFFEDEDTDLVPASLRQEATQLFRAWRENSGTQSAAEPDWNDEQLSFQLGQSIPDPAFQGMLLRDRSEGNRLRQLIEYFEQQLPREEKMMRMKQLAPLNGFGAKLADL